MIRVAPGVGVEERDHDQEMVTLADREAVLHGHRVHVVASV
jgi:hypothetical protein